VHPDPLSDVLRAVRLTGAVFFDIEGHAPWAAASARGADIAQALLPGVQHLISYHVVTEGACWVRLLEGAPVRLEPGDVIVFPHGDVHVLSSHPDAEAVPDPTVYRSALANRPRPVRFGGDGLECTRVVCGFLGCDVRPFNPLVSSLPRLIHVRAGADAPWLGQFARFALSEARNGRPGGESVLARVSELMFVEAVRRHLDALTDERTGWLAGLRDVYVGRALALLHERPERPWTLEELAREAGLSRSTLAERFAHLVGEPPMQYLARWRMQVASRLLLEGAKVASAAEAVGYDSEAAFSRAFKKLVGTPPSGWRDRRPASGGEAGA